MLAGWVLLLQSVAELEQDILMQSEPVVDLELHSSDRFVGGLVLGSSVQHFVTQLMLKCFLHLGSVAQLEVCS